MPPARIISTRAPARTEQRLAASLKRGLEADGFAVDVALDGTDGLWMARENSYDAIVLDLMLPGVDGYQLCAALRAQADWTPVLMLTAMDGELDETEGLDIGADDYLTKPFSHLVLVARLRALLRRGAPERPVMLTAGGLRLDPGSRRAWRGSEQLALTARELSVLEYLLRSAGQVVSKSDILDHVWDDDFDGDPNIVEVYIRYLRRKIDLPFGRSSIETIRGAGTGWRSMVADQSPERRSRGHRRWSRFRVRMTAAATLIVGVALTLGAVVLVWLLRTSLTRYIQSAAELRARDVVELLEGGRPPNELAVENAEESVVQVLDRTGTVVAASRNVAGQPPIVRLHPGEATTVDKLPISDDRSYRVVADSTRDGRFVVLVARTLDPAVESSTVAGGVLLAGIPILVLLVGVTTWAVTGRALRPVEAIRREVSAISDYELSRRVPQPGGDDEIARLARTMNAMLDRLQGSLDRQARFVSDASHELRNPIASIRHQLETALAHPDLTDVAQLMPELLAEDLRMERLVADLLVLARADEQALGLNRRPVDLDDLLLAQARRLRERDRVRVDTAAVSAGRVAGDPTHPRSLVANPVDNAERHANSKVRLALRVDGGWLTMTVSDDGDGIAEADRQRIFERFTRLDSARARDTGGAGLGLAIVAEVARAHGGSVRVESTSGARFVVVLPAIDTE